MPDCGFFIKLSLSMKSRWSRKARPSLRLSINLSLSIMAKVSKKLSSIKSRFHITYSYRYISLCLGLTWLSLEAYFLPFWKDLYLGITVSGLPFLILTWMILPESPRWLVSQGKLEEAQRVLEIIAKGKKIHRYYSGC